MSLVQPHTLPVVRQRSRGGGAVMTVVLEGRPTPDARDHETVRDAHLVVADHSQGSKVMIYKGSCHCGRIAFEVEGEQLTQVVDCNCSICVRKGALMWFIPREKLRLLTPDENLSTYTFNTHTIKHRFCSVCGIHPFGEGTDPSGKAMAAVNVRCLEGVKLASLPVKHFDGRSR